MKKGFTLAEILITLAAIGIVAAITIVGLVHKYQNQQYYIKFIKAYNTLSRAYQLSVAEHGEIPSWNAPIDEWDEDAVDFIREFFGKYMKTAGYCAMFSPPDKCFAKGWDKMKGLSDKRTYDSFYDVIHGDREGYEAVLLQDGSVFMTRFTGKSVINYSSRFDIVVDTNGGKGPNQYGRDIFMFRIENVFGRYELYPYGKYNDKTDYLAIVSGALQATFNGQKYVLPPRDIALSTRDEIMANCSPDVRTKGEFCAMRLAIEGKMDY